MDTVDSVDTGEEIPVDEGTGLSGRSIFYVDHPNDLVTSRDTGWEIISKSDIYVILYITCMYKGNPLTL